MSITVFVTDQYHPGFRDNFNDWSVPVNFMVSRCYMVSTDLQCVGYWNDLDIVVRCHPQDAPDFPKGEVAPVVGFYVVESFFR